MKKLLALAALALTAPSLYATEDPLPVYRPAEDPLPCLSNVPKPAVGVLPARVPSIATVPTLRAPNGHTHTCANGHTWDHTTNPTHTCQICGLSQYYQDTTPRMVGSTRSVSSGQTVYSSGGCANGQCDTGRASSRGPGLFGGRGLFR